MTAPRRPDGPIGLVLLAIWGLGVASLTLRAGSSAGALDVGDIFCVWCSSRPGADKLLNWLLFIPGGVLLCRLVGFRRTVLVGVAMTLGIEMTQVLLPGRHPSLSDVVFNTAGVATGAWLYRVGPTPAVFRFCGMAAAVFWLAPTLLLAPQPRDSQLFAIWTPDFADQPTYEGEVVRAEVGGVPVRYRLEASEAVRAAVRRREPLQFEFVAGPRPAVPTLVVGLWDEDTRPNLTVSIERTDVIVHWWSAARRLGLEHPGLRSRRALEGVAPGDTVKLEVVHGGDRWCIVVNGVGDCDVGPLVADGWRLLLDFKSMSGFVRSKFSQAWAAGIGLAVGAAVAGAGPAGILGVLVASLAAVGAWMSPDVGAGLVTAGLLVAGAALGGFLRARFAVVPTGRRS